jgi:hypothetical protein
MRLYFPHSLPVTFLFDSTADTAICFLKSQQLTIKQTKVFFRQFNLLCLRVKDTFELKSSSHQSLEEESRCFNWFPWEALRVGDRGDRCWRRFMRAPKISPKTLVYATRVPPFNLNFILHVCDYFYSASRTWEVKSRQRKCV